MVQYKKDLLYILVFGALLYFANNWGLAITDPVESNYTLTAKEMLESGDFVSPRIYGNFWYDKPGFFYWELIAAFSIFGVNEFAARFFPACFTLIALVMTYFFGRKLYGERVAFCSSLILASSVAFVYLGKAVITDMSLFVFHSAVLISFYLGYSSKNRNFYYLSYAAAAFATLTKGPVGLALPGLTILVFLCVRRDFKEILKLKIIPGLLLYFAIGGPWYYQMYTLHGMDFIGGFLGTHNVLRATVSEHPRDDVWWYYTAITFASTIPWSFGFLYSLVRGRLPIFKKEFWKNLPEDKIFLLTWALVTIGCYQMAATKYPTYTLPAMLPLALMLGNWLVDREGLVRKVACTTGTIFVILYCFAVPNYVQDNVTGKYDVAHLDEYVEPGEPIYSFGNYRTSSVYYSGRTIYKLSHIWDIADSKPENMSWNIKNVMPFYAIEELPLDKPVYVIVNNNQLKSFYEQFTPEICDLEVIQKIPTSEFIRLQYKGPVVKNGVVRNTSSDEQKKYIEQRLNK